MRKTKKNKKNYSKLIILIIFLIVLAGGIFFGINHLEEQRKLQEEERLSLIKEHYYKYVKINKATDIYDKVGNVVGKINKDVELNLVDSDITKDTKYFEIADFSDKYIYWEDVSKIDNLNISKRYQKYIPFNKNIKTKDKVTFYNKEGNYLYTLDKSYDLVVYVMDDDRYGVEFNNGLVYVLKDDVSSEYDNHNTDSSNSSGVAVLNYHFFYDEYNDEDRNTCQEVICHSKTQFKQHLDLFKEMNMFTVTTEELELYMDGKLQLPRSVLITIDDGGRTRIGVDMLTEYQMNAAIFLITSWFDPKSYYKTDYIELHSHTHNLHMGGKCPGGQGSGLKCLPKEEILSDLNASREALSGSTVFCYPFYEHNDYSQKLVQEAGFRMAFIGEVPTSYGYKLATVNGDKYRIPRFAIMTHTTLKDLREYFNEIK